MNAVIAYAVAFLSVTLSIIWVFIERRKIRRIGDISGALCESADSLRGSYEQVSSTSYEFSEMAEEQMVALENSAGSAREISTQGRQTSESTHRLLDEATGLKDLTTNGQQTVAAMVRSSQEIKDGTDQFKGAIQTSIDQLNTTVQVIRDIAEKTKIINEIVFQTKLLSFNASVEAARAGEHGKGFAVVAEEVGNLARMSGQAASEISQIVDRSVTTVEAAIRDAKNIVEKMVQESHIKAEEGYAYAQGCEEIFNDMFGKIESLSNMITDFSRSTKDQSEEIGQLESALTTLQDSVRRARLISSQTKEHATVFGEQTLELKGAVSQVLQLSTGGRARARSIPSFEWTEKLVMNVEQMDDEHLKLVDKINILIDLLNHGAAGDELLKAFHDLGAYVVLHFKNEEEYMEQIGYAQVEPHKKIHAKLLEEVGEYANALKEGRLDERKLVNFLRNWLISHIMGVDMLYAKHAQKTGRLAA